jgi:hypothetical protein
MKIINFIVIVSIFSIISTNLFEEMRTFDGPPPGVYCSVRLLFIKRIFIMEIEMYSNY